MIKTVIVCLGLFLVSMSSFNVSGFAQEKLAYVNLSKIFSEYKKTKEYDKGLEKKQKEYKRERDKKAEEIKRLRDKLELLNEKERIKKEAEIKEKIISLRELDRNKREELKQDGDKRIKEILKDIEKAVRQYAEKEGYSFVFNNRILVYEKESYDITDKIVEIVNKGYKK